MSTIPPGFLWKTWGNRYKCDELIRVAFSSPKGLVVSLNQPAGQRKVGSKNEKQAADGVAVWSKSAEVVSLAARYAVCDRHQRELVHFSGKQWQEQFHRFVSLLDDKGRCSCFAADYLDDGSFQPWTSIPLDQMVQKIATGWFPEMLQRDGLVSFLQPIWSIKQGAVYGFEALARAREGSRLITGAELIDAAKAHNSMSTFDAVARVAAVREGAAQIEPHEKLFVNVVPALIENPETDFAMTWQTIDQNDIDPSQVVFEFMESETLPDRDHLDRLVRHIRNRGAMVALDDFGAGHASLSILDNLRPDIVKFDRVLMPVGSSDNKATMIKGLVDYARSYGYLTVAEGVETLEHLLIAEHCGFDLVQGWLIGRPEARAVRPHAPFLSLQ